MLRAIALPQSLSHLMKALVIQKMQDIYTLTENIRPLSEKAMSECRKRWDSIGKPLHSLGKLEDALVQIAGIQRTPVVDIAKKALLVMCADNGVVEEGVAQTGQEVTAIVAENFFDKKTCTAVFCEKTGTDLFVLDVGMAADTPRTERKKRRRGTANFTRSPAMSREEALFAVEAGMEKAAACKAAGYRLLAAGEMGIGNTTTGSAVASVLLGLPPEAVTGRGAGLSSEGLQQKIAVIKQGIALHRPDKNDPIDVLTKVGGFDIAAMCGAYLGGALYGLPVVMDGFISCVAALLAVRIAPAAADYILASHVSKEPAGGLILQALGKSPFLTCDMCLGEGSGAVALFPLLDLAEAVYREMGTFEEIAVEAYQMLV